MIHGAHVIIYSKDSAADRAFFRDVLKYKHGRGLSLNDPEWRWRARIRRG